MPNISAPPPDKHGEKSAECDCCGDVFRRGKLVVFEQEEWLCPVCLRDRLAPASFEEPSDEGGD